MATSKLKQNIRYQKTCERLDRKVRYSGFNPDEVKYLKTKKQYEQVEKELNRFWSEAPRNNNGGVDWTSMTEETLNYFDYIHKQSEKLLNRMSKLKDKGIEVDKLLNMFMMINCNSVCY